MNLTHDPWIPVMFQDGTGRLVSLEEAFAGGGEIRDVIATPPQRVALMRLLVCVAQAALDGPREEAEWRRSKARIAPAAQEYLEAHQNAFELYAEGDEGAFLQVPNLEPTGNAVVDKLDFGLAAGNNSTLFDHEGGLDGRELPDAWRALMLLTFQCFSPGGRIGVSRWHGRATSATSEHAPCIEGSMLHTIIRSGDLLGTVHLNLVSKETIASLPNTRWGIPVWELKPMKESAGGDARTAASYLGRLVPIPRAIRLSSSSQHFTLANGISYPKFPDQREPGATVVLRSDKKEPRYLGIDLRKHPWRELGSVLATRSSGQSRGALVLDHLASAARDQNVDIWTGGLAADKGKVLDVAEWSFHLAAGALGESELNRYQEGVTLATRASGVIRIAVEAFLGDLSVSEFTKNEQGRFGRNDNRSRGHRRNVVAKATAWYWSQLDATYQVLIETASEPTQMLSDGWYKVVRTTMIEAYRRACPHQTPRQIRAYARGEKVLRLKKPDG